MGEDQTECIAFWGPRGRRGGAGVQGAPGSGVRGQGSGPAHRGPSSDGRAGNSAAPVQGGVRGWGSPEACIYGASPPTSRRFRAPPLTFLGLTGRRRYVHPDAPGAPSATVARPSSHFRRVARNFRRRALPRPGAPRGFAATFRPETHPPARARPGNSEREGKKRTWAKGGL